MVKYKFKPWHLIIAIVAVLYLNTQYNFLGAIISADGFTNYGESTLGVTGQTCENISVSQYFKGGVPTCYIGAGCGGPYTATLCTSKYWIESQTSGLIQPIISDSSINFYDGDRQAEILPTMKLSGAFYRANIFLQGYGIPGSSRSETSVTLNIHLVDNVNCGNATVGSPCYGAGGGPSGAHAIKILTLSSSNREQIIEGLFEIKPSFLNPKEFGVWYQGVFVGSTVSPFDNTYLLFEIISGKNDYGGPTTAKITDFRYQYQFSCEQSSNDLLGMETFSGGQNLSVDDLRFPIKSFCLAHPVIVTAPGGSTSSAEPYQELIQGNSLTIPADQTWTMFYVFDNSAGLVPTTCSVEEAYNINTDQCTTLGGVVQICSEGVIDPNSGTCTVTASVVCPADYTYNSVTKQCEKPGDVAPIICPADYTYNSVSDKCEKMGNLAPPTCPVDYTYNSVTDQCERSITTIEPNYEALCPEGRFDITTNTCIYNPPIQRVCEAGTWDESSGSCNLIYTVESQCPEGQVYDDALQRCEGVSSVVGGAQVTDLRAGAEELQKPIEEFKEGNWLPLLIILAVLILLAAVIFRKQTKVIIKRVFRRRKR